MNTDGPDGKLAGLLAKGVGDDLQAPALLDEQTLEEVRNRYEDLGAEVRLRSS